jgi:hypothetical protein
VALAGEPKIGEPLISAWDRALNYYQQEPPGFELTRRTLEAKREAQNKMGISVEDAEFFAQLRESRLNAIRNSTYGDMAKAIYPAIMNGAMIEKNRFAEILNEAPIGWLAYTQIMFDANFLEFELPDFSAAHQWTKRGLLSAPWPTLPLGTISEDNSVAQEEEPDSSQSAEDCLFVLEMLAEPEEKWTRPQRHRMLKVGPKLNWSPKQTGLLGRLSNTATKTEGNLMRQEDKKEGRQEKPGIQENPEIALMRLMDPAIADLMLQFDEERRRSADREARLNVLRNEFLGNDDKASTSVEEVRNKALNVFARRVAHPQISKDVLLRIAEFLVTLRYGGDYVALQQFPTELPGKAHIPTRAEKDPYVYKRLDELNQARECIRRHMPELLERNPEYAIPYGKASCGSPAGGGALEPASPDGDRRASDG